jgi:toxin YoeB
MEIVFKSGALEDIDYWKKSGNKIIQNKISELIKSIASNPEKGIGKPEKLKGSLSGYWSRRITKEHRIVYTIDYQQQLITIFSVLGHYKMS